ncbi:MAG: 23S rRNA (adenine(2503)-C(2))-methyltransferase RlmN [Patescibacteria group bacterium]
MHLADVAAFMKEKGLPAFRMGQAKRAFYVEYLKSWDELTTFPKALRDELTTAVPWDTLTEAKTQISGDGDTVKRLFRCTDGKNIEAVLMRHGDGRNTVCISCQVGCPMACSFCATGTMGLKRNLNADEIVEQVIHFARFLKQENARVTNVVFMGMGEPMNNYEEVMKAVRLLNDQEGFNLGARHITISTCGIVPGILKLADEPFQVNLAISLHSAVDETRTKIMPVNKPYPIKKLMDAVNAYTNKTNRKVFFEYLLLKGVNDTQAEANALGKLLQHNFRLFHVNLIKFHDTESDTLKATPKDARISFMNKLKRLGVPVTHRLTFGEDIDAACGQLAVNQAENTLAQGKEAIRANRADRVKAKAKATA